MTRALTPLVALVMAGLLTACSAPPREGGSEISWHPTTAQISAQEQHTAPASHTPHFISTETKSSPVTPPSQLHQRDLWDRLVQGFAIPELNPSTTAGQRQAQHLAWYRQRPEHLGRVFTRARLYLHDIVQATEAAGLPLEVALLPAVESAFQPQAVSSAAADGLWQFIAPTGRRYALKQHLFLDERRNPRAATRAAMRYLDDLRRRYGGDMQLALAAYNCGEGCIDQAVRHAQAQGLAGTFSDLRLNAETAQYVPRLLALAQLVSEAVTAPAQARGTQMATAGLPPLDDAPYFGSVELERDIDVALAARLAGMPLADFLALNPQHRKPLIAAAANQEILLPIDRIAGFERAVRQHRGPLASWSAMRVHRTQPARQLAKDLGWSLDGLLTANGMGTGNRLIKAQSTLLVPRPAHKAGSDIADHLLESSWLATAPMPVLRKKTARSTHSKRAKIAAAKTNLSKRSKSR